jgi:hypothetical protein
MSLSSTQAVRKVQRWRPYPRHEERRDRPACWQNRLELAKSASRIKLAASSRRKPARRCWPPSLPLGLLFPAANRFRGGRNRRGACRSTLGADGRRDAGTTESGGCRCHGFTRLAAQSATGATCRVTGPCLGDVRATFHDPDQKLLLGAMNARRRSEACSSVLRAAAAVAHRARRFIAPDDQGAYLNDSETRAR